MFRGPSFIVSTMQEETTPIFKRLWYDWTQHQPGIEPTNPLGQCWVPPIVTFYNQQGLLRTYSSPGGSIRSPHPGSLRGGYPESFVETKLLSVVLITTMWQVLSRSIIIVTPCDHGLIKKIITRSVLYLFYLELNFN